MAGKKSSARLSRAAALLLAAPLLFNAISPAISAGAVELIMFEEAGCAWCEKWQKEIGAIYAKTPEGRRAPLRRLDIHDPLPPELNFIAKGAYTPTFVLVDRGREIGRIRGYPGEDFFWGLLGRMLERLSPAKPGSTPANQ